jgi:hypothetical protein
MTVPKLTLVETDFTYWGRRFEQEMAASRAAASLRGRRIHAELACRYAVKVSQILKRAEGVQGELPFCEGLALAS